MISLLGTIAVLVALGASSLGTVVAFAAGSRNGAHLWPWARRAAYANLTGMAVACGLMEYALIAHDFSVSYVAEVGSRATPLYFTIVSLWASLDGSILFWGLILATYIAAMVYRYRSEFADYMPFVVGTSLLISTFFAFLIAGISNPFEAVSPVPADGPGPNPLLQNHPLMAFHPPALYLGYVGMTVPFAMVVAALLRGRLEAGWLRPIRTWMMVPWIFLTIGIVAGGWWSYEVLGWGGYWAWDPVENASFLPWLTATAFLHSALLQERRGILKGWTVSLAIATFLLTLLGTFMTRSGVFNSVHSFTQSAIGPVFLAFFFSVTVACVVLLALRVDRLSTNEPFGRAASREAAFLVNNLLFVALTFTVLLGTVFPMLVEAVKGQRISVGEPYFNSMAVPIGVAILFLMGVGPALPWGRTTAADLKQRFLWPGAAALAATTALLALGIRRPWPLLTFALAAFATWVTLAEVFGPVRVRMRQKGEKALPALGQVLRRGRRRVGGYLVHLAVIVTIVAIAASSAFEVETSGTLRPGESMQIEDYTITFIKAQGRQEPHRFSLGAELDVRRGERSLGVMAPRLNFYETMREPLGSPAVHTSLGEDLYLVLLKVEDDGSYASIGASIHPLVAWIWWSLPLMAIGTVLALWPARSSRAPLPTPQPSKRRRVPAETT